MTEGHEERDWTFSSCPSNHFVCSLHLRRPWCRWDVGPCPTHFAARRDPPPGRASMSSMGAVMSQDEVLATASQRVGLTVDGKYKITGVLGVGGMGVVYEAEHL